MILDDTVDALLEQMGLRARRLSRETARWPIDSFVTQAAAHGEIRVSQAVSASGSPRCQPATSRLARCCRQRETRRIDDPRRRPRAVDGSTRQFFDGFRIGVDAIS